MAASVSLPEIFDELRDLLARYSPGLTVTLDEPGHYELFGSRPVTLAGRTVDRLYFAGVRMQKHFVGFHFFPIYTHPARFEGLAPELRALLKGKSCFNLKALDAQTLDQLGGLLDLGFALYRSEGLI